MRYEMLWRNKWLTSDTKNIDDFIGIFKSTAQMFEEWKAAGIELDPESGIQDDFAEFFTENEEVAKTFEFEIPTWKEEFFEDEDIWLDEELEQEES